MKTTLKNQRRTAMTTIELLAVVFILVIVAGFMLPALTRPRGCRAQRINCISNLKQIGLGMRMWANDHGDKFPWQVSMSETGTLEFVESDSLLYYHFLVVSNELTSPKVLACNDDKKKSRTSEWDKFDDRNLSYFVGLEADESKPQTILTGDRNILGGQPSSNRIMRFHSQSQPGWGTDLHNSAGNIGLADGSAHQLTRDGLSKQIHDALLSLTNVTELRLVIPKPN